MRKLLVAAVALAVSASALAQSSTPAYQNNQSEARRQSSGSQGNAELFFMVERLQREVRELRGTIEEQRHKLDQLSRQSRERYIDLDQRILELSEQGPGPQSGPSGANSSNRTESQPSAERQRPAPVAREYRQPTAEEEQAYERIQNLIRQERDYDAAIGQLYDFISKYPEGDLTVNAYYWLGEVYLVKPQLEQAKQAFSIVATRYGDHRKAPDALYKLGVVHDRMGEKEQAERYMKRVVDQYGASQAAVLAKKYLETS